MDSSMLVGAAACVVCLVVGIVALELDRLMCSMHMPKSNYFLGEPIIVDFQFVDFQYPLLQQLETMRWLCGGRRPVFAGPVLHNRLALGRTGGWLLSGSARSKNTAGRPLPTSNTGRIALI